MSRSGYSYDGWDDDGAAAMWSGWMANAFRSHAGRAFLRELITALDAMPVKELIAEKLIDQNGQSCALGTVAIARKLDRGALPLDPTDYEATAAAFGISEFIAREVMDQNDSMEWPMQQTYGPLKPGLPAYFRPEVTPAQRWQRMRAWAQTKLDNAEAYWTRRTMAKLRKDLERRT